MITHNTPAPWVGEDDNGHFNSDHGWSVDHDEFSSLTMVPIWGGGKVIALVVDGQNYYDNVNKEMMANARIFAQAPVAIEALEAFITQAEGTSGTEFRLLIKDARRIVKAARGES